MILNLVYYNLLQHFIAKCIHAGLVVSKSRTYIYIFILALKEIK
jgi:hypothetical protein